MLEKLDERERLAVIGLIAVVVFLTLVYLIKSAYEERQELSEKVNETRSGFTTMDKSIKDYNYYRSLKSGEEEKVTDTLAKLEDLMKKYSFTNYNMNNSTNTVLKEYNKTIVDVTLRSVPLQDVFKMIYDIEMNKQINCKVDSLSFRKTMQGKELYEVSIKFASYTRAVKKNG
ncbi:MAG: hypothetical protein SFU98_10630 [Leptospiraceae bacterium]|nr:hypothetical protein [Leptospiraceae bacterium]